MRETYRVKREMDSTVRDKVSVMSVFRISNVLFLRTHFKAIEVRNLAVEEYFQKKKDSCCN